MIKTNRPVIQLETALLRLWPKPKTRISPDQVQMENDTLISVTIEASSQIEDDALLEWEKVPMREDHDTPFP